MVDKQIIDFPGTTTVGNSSVFHVHDGGVNKKIDTISLVSQINERLTYPQSSTTQSGIVQLNNSVTSTSTTQAATANAVRLVNNAVNSLSSSLTVVSSNVDTTPGRIVNTGWMGHGVAVPLTNADDLLNLPSLAYGSNIRYVWTDSSRPVNRPAPDGGMAIREYYGSSNERITVRGASTSDIYSAVKTGGVWSGWIKTVNGTDLVSSLTDTTNNKIPTVGWMGHGKPIILTATDDVLNLPYHGTQTNSKYTWYGSSTAPSGLPFNSSGYLDRLVLSSSYETLYARSTSSTPTLWTNTKNNNVWSGWSEIGAGGSGGIPDAPSDGNLYGRRDAAWSQIDTSGGSGDITSEMQGFVDLGEMGLFGGASATIDLSAGRYFFINMNNASTSGGFTFNLINEPESGAVDMVLFVSRPGRKSTWTLPANVKWAQGIVPSQMSVNINSVVAVHIFKTPNWVNCVATVNTMELAP